MKKATAGQRIGAMAIDLLIVWGFVWLINLAIQKIAGFAPIPDGYYNVISSMDAAAIEAFMNSPEWITYQAQSQLVSAINMSVFVLVFALYFVLLPLKAKFTLGRYIFKIKVVDENREPVSVGKTAIRELIGVMIIDYIGCICCGITVIINIIMLASKGTTIHDKIAGTTVVSSIYEEEEPFNTENEKKDYIDAETNSGDKQ